MMAIVAQFACVVTATIAGAQRSPALFDSREGLSLRIAVDVGALMKERDPDGAALVSVFEYAAHIAALDSVPGLDPKFVQETRKYLDEFFKTIQGPSAVKREFADGCRRA